MILSTFLLLLHLWLGPTASPAGVQPLTVKVRPTQCLDPCNVRVTVHIEPNEQNRRLELELYSEDYYRFSELDVQPPQASLATLEIWYRGLKEGDYELTAKLYREYTAPISTVKANIGVR